MKTLYEIHTGKNGKESDKWESYFYAYEENFSKFRFEKIKILEIGVQNGGSLESWAEYFPNATDIVGVDVDPACGGLKFIDPRINVLVADACADTTVKRIMDDYDSFDIIIDDGSHTSRDVIVSFQKYFRHVKDEGLYLAEDLHTSYFSNFQGGVWHPLSSIRFFNFLADCINSEHWGVSLSTSTFLKRFSDVYKVEFDADVLSHINAVEFRNSICTVAKRSPEKNILGKRLICGSEDAVAKNKQTLGYKQGVVIDESFNEWSQKDPFFMMEKLKKDFQVMNKMISELNKDIIIYKKIIEDQRGNESCLNARINSLLSSRSWKITAPLRRIVTLLRGLGRF